MTITIIGGTFKGHKIKTPQEEASKPTLSMMRKSVFDICQGIIAHCRFLDLFSCSGAMGIEAISRGASHVTFVEKSRIAARIIMQNVEKLHIENSSKILCQDAFSSLPKLPMPAYDIIYIDPPYHLSQQDNSPVLSLIHALDTSSLLTKGGMLFVEEGYPAVLPLDFVPLQKLSYKSCRRFGGSSLHQLLIDKC